MKKLLQTLFFLLLIPTVAYSQAEGMKEVYDDAEYFFYSESYNDALINYLKIYRRGFQTNANINFKIGYCYLHTAEKAKALPYLEEAAKNTSLKFKEGTLKEDKAPLEAFLYLGNAQRVMGNLDKAIEAYDKYLQQIPDQKTDEGIYAKKQMEACKVAMDLQKSPVKYSVAVLDKTINNSSANFNPIVTPEETVLAFVSRLRFYDAIFVSRKVKDKWSIPENITPQIQSDGNQYTSSISSDGNTIYLTKEDNYDSDIYLTTFDGKTWTKSVPLNKNINTKFWESHACVSADGKTMYFASNRKGSTGGMDIFISQLGANNEWGPATSIGPSINSSLDDDYPFISEDGNTLYFCSQGHNTMGGFDVFYSKKEGSSWSTPKNIGFPINTTDDDIFFCPVLKGTVAYQAIYPKEGGLGDLDIVRYEIGNPVAIKGNLKNLEISVSEVAAVNASNGEVISVTYNAETMAFEFNAAPGQYYLTLKGVNTNEKTHIFTIPATGQSLIIIPELIGTEKIAGN